MSILVIGGTGTVGSQVVKGLLARKTSVKVLTRDLARTKALPAGVEGLAGDLKDMATINSAFRGLDAVFMLNAVSPTETFEGLLGVAGARAAGVKRFVYLSVQEADRAPWLPHFGAKLPMELALKASPMDWTILRPNNFYQNDYLFKDAILNGVYPQPIGDTGIARVDVRDIAEAAVIALTTSGHERQTYDLVGPGLVTGTGTAETWSRALGGKVVYGGNDLDAWEKQFLQYMPAWMVFDYKHMYAYFHKDGFKATATTIERQTRLLGHPPRPFEDFAMETGRAWKA
jgi:uncharacterized protein YbjT (DUF2867 family)